MKKFYSIPSLICVLFSWMINSPAFAQESNDSLSIDLKEIVVEGESIRTSPTSVTYYPTSKQKSAATSAIDLLQKMGISQLSVDIMGTSATTVTGQTITYFINFVPATEQDLSGIRTKDVKKVEYLEFPADPRFRNAEHVVHYIMVEYDYGGYTKLSDYLWFSGDLDSNVLNVYSKFNYKRMTYDVYVGEYYSKSRHFGTNNNEQILMRGADGDYFTLDKDLTTEHAFDLGNKIPVNFRATYNDNTKQITNSAWFNFNRNPHFNSSGSFTTSNNELSNNYDWVQNNSNTARSGGWNGNFFFMFNRGWSMNFGGTFQYSSTNDYSLYTSSLNDTDIRNNATDRTYTGDLSVQLLKNFTDNHQAWIEAKHVYVNSDVKYLSYNEFNKFSFLSGTYSIGYTGTFQNVRVRADMGLSFEDNSINSISSTTLHPNAHLNVNYSPNRLIGLGLWFQYATSSPSESMKSPNVIQVNDFEYKTGNPALKPTNFLQYQIYCNWTPNNIFSSTFYTGLNYFMKQSVAHYEHYNNGEAIIKRWDNCGNFLDLSLGANISVRLFNNSLQLAANPSIYFSKITGYTPLNKFIFRGIVSATYFIKGFYATIGYYSPYRSLDRSGLYTFCKSPEYILTLGWANQDWNIRVNFKNVFESTWNEMSYSYHSPIYSYTIDGIGMNRHRQISLMASYTFGYGRKINRNNEIGTGGDAINSIM